MKPEFIHFLGALGGIPKCGLAWNVRLRKDWLKIQKRLGIFVESMYNIVCASLRKLTKRKNMSLIDLVMAVKDLEQQTKVIEFLKNSLANNNLSAIVNEIEKGQRGSSHIFIREYISTAAISTIEAYQIRATTGVDPVKVTDIAHKIMEDIKAGKTIKDLFLRAIVLIDSGNGKFKILDGNHTRAAGIEAELEEMPIIRIPADILDDPMAYRIGMALNRVEDGVIRTSISTADLESFFARDEKNGICIEDATYLGLLSLLFNISVFSLGKTRATYLRKRKTREEITRITEGEANEGLQLKRWTDLSLKAEANKHVKSDVYASYSTSQAISKGFGQFVWSMVTNEKAQLKGGESMNGVLLVYQADLTEPRADDAAIKARLVVSNLGLSDRITIIALQDRVEFAKIEKNS